MFLNKLKVFLAVAIFFITLISLTKIEEMMSVIMFSSIAVFISSRLTQAYAWEINLSILKSLRYICWLFFEIIKSSIQTIKVILNNKLYNPEFKKVKIKEASDATIAYANSVTLTPGTTSTTFTKEELSVHCLNKGFANSLADKTMIKKIQELKND